jgi:hypothetical protein
MAKTAQQELSDQINRLHSNLVEYKKAQANPPYWMNTKALACTIEQIEAEISELHIKIEALVTLNSLYSNAR